jgi:hypothetical protein
MPRLKPLNEKGRTNVSSCSKNTNSDGFADAKGVRADAGQLKRDAAEM